MVIEIHKKYVKQSFCYILGHVESYIFCKTFKFEKKNQRLKNVDLIVSFLPSILRLFYFQHNRKKKLPSKFLSKTVTLLKMLN